MINVPKLKGKIVENNLTVEQIAEALGIDKSTIYRKFNNNGEDFTIKQTDEIAKLLNLSSDEAMSIFFSQFVA